MKWEYRQLTSSGRGDAEKLNQIGSEGWEMVSACVDKGFWLYVFKRPLNWPLD